MTTSNNGPRSVRQIVDQKTGKPAQAHATSTVWVPGNLVFSTPTDKNQVTPFTTGKAYFADLIDECRKATTEICIAGWQISWDALLAPGMRLYDLLREVASKNKALNIYIMPWMRSLPVETYDRQTNAVLLSINDDLGTRQIHAFSSPSYADADQAFFAHHQKQVVIDRKVAYLGGMDLCYGRYDDATYDLHADKDGREAMNRYNGCVVQVGTVKESQVVNTDDLLGVVDNLRLPGVHAKSNADQAREKLSQPGHWQLKYQPASKIDSGDNARRTASDDEDFSTLDPQCQPRMPWQDVHCKVEGPAVSHLLRNFVLRWNIIAGARDKLKMPDAPETYAPAGNMQVQVLRSAPAGHRAAELKAQSPKPAQPQPAGLQADICSAMLLLIEKARRFIYIENQFFVSDFGREAERTPALSPAAQYINSFGDPWLNQNTMATAAAKHSSEHHGMGYGWLNSDLHDVLRPPVNKIVPALLESIARAIRADTKFHVYITLPVYSEGTLCTASTAVQVYWTMQTLVFGSNSLLNGIRRALKARELRQKKDNGFARAFEPGNNEYEDVEIERCFEYVTLLNLRNWVQLGNRYETEQIYVHTKTMIVDDLYALIGSANINDRSLLGSRDSELAVLVMDNDVGHADVNGKGSHTEVRGFARNLRMEIWKKLFGFTGGVRPATELKEAIEQPGKRASWQAIQQRAQKNAELYEAAFPWVPRSWVNDAKTGERVEASILPTWDRGAPAPPDAKWGRTGNLGSSMPFQKGFWNAPRHKPNSVDGLKLIKGFMTALPIMWTKDENNRFDYPTALVADNEAPASAEPSAPSESVDPVAQTAQATKPGGFETTELDIG